MLEIEGTEPAVEAGTAGANREEPTADEALPSVTVASDTPPVTDPILSPSTTEFTQDIPPNSDAAAVEQRPAAVAPPAARKRLINDGGWKDFLR